MMYWTLIGLQALTITVTFTMQAAFDLVQMGLMDAVALLLERLARYARRYMVPDGELDSEGRLGGGNSGALQDDKARGLAELTDVRFGASPAESASPPGAIHSVRSLWVTRVVSLMSPSQYRTRSVMRTSSALLAVRTAFPGRQRPAAPPAAPTRRASR